MIEREQLLPIERQQLLPIGRQQLLVSHVLPKAVRSTHCLKVFILREMLRDANSVPHGNAMHGFAMS